MPRRVHDPIGLPEVISRQEALEAGLSDGAIRSRLESGLWIALTAGQYLRKSLDTTDQFEWARQHHVLGAVSAAKRIRGAARTWVDVARTSTLSDSLSAGDSLLRLGLAKPDDIARAATRSRERRGVARAEFALPFLNSLRENPFESRAFGAFIEWGLPLPECQVEIVDTDGFVARVDFLWRWARLIAEADGRLKYTEPEALYAEKRREDRLRANDYRVVRFGWGDLDERLRRRLERELSRVA